MTEKKRSHKKKPSDVIKTETQQLQVTLTDDEIRQAGLRLAQLHGELENHKAKAKEVKSQLKADEDAITARIAQTAHMVNDRKELRLVEVQHLADFKKGTVKEIRQDTKEVVRERELLPVERQEKFPAVAQAEEQAQQEIEERAEEST